MPRSNNAKVAVEMYEEIKDDRGLSKEDTWKGITILLETCEIFIKQGVGWTDHHGVVVHRESNDIGTTSAGNPNAGLRRGRRLNDFLSRKLNISRDNLCSSIGKYYEHPSVKDLAPNNIKGHAFRSIIVNILRDFGDNEIEYREEVDPNEIFPGNDFSGLSSDPRIDIAAWRDGKLAALLSTRWGVRHDRMEVIQEADIYDNASSSDFCFYPVLAENVPSRLDKCLKNSPPRANDPSISDTVHYNPSIVYEGLYGSSDEEIGYDLSNLKDLEYLVGETYRW